MTAHGKLPNELTKVRTIKRKIFSIALLTVVWLVLRETFSVADVIFGVFISIVCLWYSQKFIPLRRIEGVSFFKLVLYHFYLIWQIYVSGFYVIKVIFTGANTYISTVKTAIKNEELRVVFADSITLTPGSVMLDLTGHDVTVLWLRDKNEAHKTEDADRLIKGQLEKKLMAAQQDTEERR